MSLGKGLGRGFESLIPTDIIDDQFDPTAAEDEATSQLKEINIEDIIRDEDQPRREFTTEAVEALAASIKEHGVLQPIVVTKEEGKYKIVAGERRWRASKLAGLKTMPAIVRTLDYQHRLEISIIENAQREDLNAIELATAYAKLKTQFNMSAKDIAARIGKSEAAVVNTMRLLNLPDSAKQTMVKEKLPEGVMRPLITAEPELIEKVLPKIVDEGWTARKVERFISENKKKSSATLVKRDDYRKEEDTLSKKFGGTVKIQGRSITFKCKNEQELRDLIDKLS
ncbi:ParB/RepB/Spo0J family partition protein [Candidatus Saccharibacteria bacterium]|nr:ParB/RepB/Spo0J family partition protein [Candidatus Saccharibacteria bacterium]